MTEFRDLRLMLVKDVAWQHVTTIQVKRYDVSRRMALQGGPLESLPLLGAAQRFAVEVINKDDTRDRIYWLDSSVEAHRCAEELAAAHGLIVRMVP